jgi:hypothetical protein
LQTPIYLEDRKVDPTIWLEDAGVVFALRFEEFDGYVCNIRGVKKFTMYPRSRFMELYPSLTSARELLHSDVRSFFSFFSSPESISRNGIAFLCSFLFYFTIVLELVSIRFGDQVPRHETCRPGET